MHRNLLDRKGHVAGENTGDDTSQESGASLGPVQRTGCGDEPGNKARCQPRPIRDANSNVARQDRHHQRKCQATELIERIPEAIFRNRQSFRRGRATQGQRHGDEQSAGDHKGNHVGNAIHQRLVHGLPNTAQPRIFRGVLRLACRCPLILPLPWCRLQGLGQQLLGVFDGLVHAGGHQALAVESVLCDDGIGTDDNGIGLLNVLCAEVALHADRTVRFNLDAVAQLFGGSL